MRLGVLLLTLLAFGILIYLQLGNIKLMLYLTRAEENPNNVNKQLEEIQKKNDQYNKSIENYQTQTDGVLNNVNKSN